MNIVVVPINARLISLSIRIIRPLIHEGHNVWIAKSCSLGEDISGWGNFNNIPFNIINIDILRCSKKSNFIRYIYNAFLGYLFLKNYIPKDIDLFIIYHDSYADGEIFLKYAKRHKIKTLLLQEGFHSRTSKYDISLYGFCTYVRNLLLPFLFSKRPDGLNADFLALWSNFGMKADLIKIGRNFESIFVVGNPFSAPARLDWTPPLSETNKKTALIAHQPLFPRYSNKLWEIKQYLNVIDELIKNGYKVIFKTHPRFIHDQNVLFLIDYIYSNFGRSNPNLEIINSNINSELFIDTVDLFITFFSMTAYAYLKNNIPTIFIEPQKNEFSVLKNLSSSNAIFYLNNNLPLRQILIQLTSLSHDELTIMNHNAINYLFGENFDFDFHWIKAIHDVGNIHL